MNRADSVSFQIPVKDHSDSFSLFGVDDHFLPDFVIAQNVAVSIDNAVFHRGLLSGFDNYEVTGFSSGAVFMPMMGSIPFVGYIFEVEEGTDKINFVNELTANCNPRWNVCVEADETLVGYYNNFVFFLMCPISIEG